jgi:hypothetical protein
MVKSIRPTAIRTWRAIRRRAAATGARRLYDAQANPQQRYYYDNRGYAPQVQ